MTSQNAYDRYNDRYNNEAYLAAVVSMTLAEAIELQDTAIMLCEFPGSKLGTMVTERAALTNDVITTFLALFV